MILDFSDETGKRHFEFVFVGFVLGGSLQEKKGMQVLRTEVGFFEKLESISEPMPCGKKLVNGEPQRQLKTAPEDGPPPSASIQVTMQEYDLLYNYLGAVPWQSGSPTKHAVETIDWLDKIQRESRA
jgi:hypothetical protein